MKTQLTKEQSKHLIELGVNEDKATYSDDVYDWSINDYPRYFTLTDLLEILPKEIDIDNKKYGLFTEFNSQYAFAYYCSANTPSLGCQRKEELIDALYELTCWYYSKFYYGEFLKSEYIKCKTDVEYFKKHYIVIKENETI